jgi:hypothetical protein
VLRWVGLVVFIGCLNPRPEELPSALQVAPVDSASGQPGAAPSAAGAEPAAPEFSINAAPADNADAPPPPSPESTRIALPPADAGADDGADAGSDGADAGAN